jgi:hypothetical protein
LFYFYGLGGKISINFYFNKHSFHSYIFILLFRELASRLGRTTTVFENWKDKLNNTDTSNDASFKKLHSDLARDLDALVKLVNHAENSVKVVERQRKRFSHISDNELTDRRRYVTATRQKVRNMKEMTTSPKTRQKIQQDKQKKLFGGDSNGGVGGLYGNEQKRKTYSDDNNEFYDQQKSDQQQYRQQQDDMMDGMGASVEALNTYAVAIGDELDKQKVLLDEFGNEMATVQTRMDKVLGGMQKLLKTSNNSVICLIIFLTIVACVLFFLVIYT